MERWNEGIWEGGNENMGGGMRMCGERRPNVGVGDRRIWGRGRPTDRPTVTMADQPTVKHTSELHRDPHVRCTDVPCMMYDVYTSPPGRSVHSNTNSTSPGSIQPCRSYCAKTFIHCL